MSGPLHDRDRPRAGTLLSECTLEIEHSARDFYPDAQRLLITADGGDSNGWRLRLWKWELQRLADQTGLALRVCHFPPGTSKWNKVEHRLFSFIPSNRRGEPLRDYETVVGLIAATTTAKGLTRHLPIGSSQISSGSQDHR